MDMEETSRLPPEAGLAWIVHRYIPARREEEFLADMREVSSNLAVSLARSLLKRHTLAELLPRIADADLQRAFRKIDPFILAMAMRSVEPTVRERMEANISERARKALVEDIRFIGDLDRGCDHPRGDAAERLARFISSYIPWSLRQRTLDAVAALDHQVLREIEAHLEEKKPMPLTPILNQLSDRYLQLVVRRIKPGLLLVALAGLDEPQRERVAANLSEDANAELKRLGRMRRRLMEMDVLDAQERIVNLLDVEFAEERICEILEGFVEAGEIVLAKSEGEMMIDEALENVEAILKEEQES